MELLITFLDQIHSNLPIRSLTLFILILKIRSFIILPILYYPWDYDLQFIIL